MTGIQQDVNALSPTQSKEQRAEDCASKQPAPRASKAVLYTMTAILLCLDLIGAVLSLYLAYITVFAYIDWSNGIFSALSYTLLREWKFGVVPGFGNPSDGFGPYFSILPFVPLLRVITNWKIGLYDLAGEYDAAEELVDIFRSVTTGTMLIIVFTFCYRDAANVPGSHNVNVFLWDWGYCFAFMLASRCAVRFWQLRRRKQGKDLLPVIVIGDNEVASKLRDEVQRSPEIGYRFVEQITLGDAPEEIERQLRDLPRRVTEHGVDEVFIATTRLSQYQILSLLMSMGPKSQVKFKLLPDLLGCFPRKVRLSQLGNVPLLELFTEPIRGVNRALKRALDIVVSLVALIVLSPVLIAAAIAIKLTSPGPILFKQTRIGLDCRPFTFFKLRTMYVDADDARHARFMEQVIKGGGVKTADGRVVYKEENDPRVTPVGRFLRRYSIDEIPQFFNVLAGDMSVVGPRPPITYEVEKYADWQKGRLAAKPGITGVWQVSGRNAVSFEEMAKMDIAYMENWSLWGDIKIILRTIPVVLRGTNAY